MAPNSLIFFLIFIFKNSVHGDRLDSLNKIFPMETEDLFLPNERKTIDDCKFRYFKYGERRYIPNNCIPPGSAGGANALPAELYEFPHMAAIGWTLASGDVNWDCGGSLIAENFVLTAAHCTRNEEDLEPDIVRLGDIFLNSTLDDSVAQQLIIKNITRHPRHSFNARYADIALIELEGKVTLTDAVCPACLWLEDEILFPRLETAGYGATGFGEPKSGRLLKLSLSPISIEKCHDSYDTQTRKLHTGLSEEHLCAVDPKMDTCPGDSGGPLQIELYAFQRMTPYVVGITSFGKTCGVGEPGVYTRVSQFVNWIKLIVGRKFDPIDCAHRYRKFHKQVFNLFWDKYTDSLVSLIWSDTNTQMECRGSLVDFNYVLTSAQCTINGGTNPTHVEIKGNRIEITRIIRHPEYKSNQLYHDIALVQLKAYTNFLKDMTPICLWKNKLLPSDEVTVTLNRLEILASYNLTHSNPLQQNPGSIHKNLTDGSKCSRLRQNVSSRLSNGVSENQMEICVRPQPFLVPKTCKLDRLERRIQNGERKYDYAFAINSVGDDCGYGTPVIMTKIPPYYDWIESVILNKTFAPSDAIVFRNTERFEGDKCQLQEDEEGLCVRDVDCRMLIEENKSKHRIIKYCTFEIEPVVCCPLNYVTDIKDKFQDTSSEEKEEEDDCSSKYGDISRIEINEDICTDEQYVQFKHLAQILWANEDWKCLGALISDKHVLTSAECGKSSPDFVILGLFDTTYETFQVINENVEDTYQILNVSKIEIHPEFQTQTKNHNIAIITLAEAVSINEYVVPACLWKNSTHTPFHLYSSSVKDNNATIYQNNKLATQQDVCNNYPEYTGLLTDKLMCVDNDDLKQLFCEVPGAPLQAVLQENQHSIPYVVGVQDFLDCNRTTYSVYTRVASYYDWIKSNIA